MSTATARIPRVHRHEVHEVLSRSTCWSTAIDWSCSTSSAATAPGSTTPARPREVLDLFTCFATLPDGLQPPELADAEFRAAAPAAAQQPDQLRPLHAARSPSSSTTFARTAARAPLRRTSSSSTAARWRSRTRSRPPSTGRCARTSPRGKGEKGHQVLHFREAFHGRSGYTLSLTNTADPRKTQYFPKFDWPRVDNPKLALPGHRRGLARGRGRGAPRARRRSSRRLRSTPRRHRRDHHRADPGRGRRQPLPPRVPARAARGSPTSTTCCSSSTRCRPASASPAAGGRFEHFGVRARRRRLRQEDAGVRHRGRPRASTRSTPCSRSSSRINSTWGGNLVDMVRCQRYIEIIEEDGPGRERGGDRRARCSTGLREPRADVPRHASPTPAAAACSAPSTSPTTELATASCGPERARRAGSCLRRAVHPLPARPRRRRRRGGRGGPKDGAGPRRARLAGRSERSGWPSALAHKTVCDSRTQGRASWPEAEARRAHFSAGFSAAAAESRAALAGGLEQSAGKASAPVSRSADAGGRSTARAASTRTGTPASVAGHGRRRKAIERKRGGRRRVDPSRLQRGRHGRPPRATSASRMPLDARRRPVASGRTRPCHSGGPRLAAQAWLPLRARGSSRPGRERLAASRSTVDSGARASRKASRRRVPSRGSSEPARIGPASPLSPAFCAAAPAGELQRAHSGRRERGPAQRDECARRGVAASQPSRAW